MEPILGDDFQERKIAEMSEHAHKLFPQIGLHVLKGMFRVSIRAALAREHEETWQRVHQRPARERKAFFERILEGTRAILEEEGISSADITMLFEELRNLNVKYWSA